MANTMRVAVTERLAAILGAAVIGFALISLAAVPSVSAQDHKDLGSFNKWQAYSYSQSGGIRCTMASQPIKDEGDYSKRGDIWAFVMHRPKEGATGEVGFHMGYPIKEGSTVEVAIGGSKFRLYASGEGAYAWRDDEPKLIRAMRAGATMVVVGTSSRGTKTTDTYSLSGFTAANKAINDACNVN